jgi:hypothetical protein
MSGGELFLKNDIISEIMSILLQSDTMKCFQILLFMTLDGETYMYPSTMLIPCSVDISFFLFHIRFVGGVFLAVFLKGTVQQKLTGVETVSPSA